MSCKSSFGEVQIEFFLTHTHIKKHTQMTFQIYVFIKVVFSNTLFMNIFSRSSPLIWISFFFNWIVIQLLNQIEIEFKSHSMYSIEKLIQFNSNYMQCH
jgi:hypothetical protein